MGGSFNIGMTASLCRRSCGKSSFWPITMSVGLASKLRYSAAARWLHEGRRVRVVVPPCQEPTWPTCWPAAALPASLRRAMPPHDGAAEIAGLSLRLLK